MDKQRCFIIHCIHTDDTTKGNSEALNLIVDYSLEYYEALKSNVVGTIIQTGEKFERTFFPKIGKCAYPFCSKIEECASTHSTSESEKDIWDFKWDVYYAEFETKRDLEMIMFGMQFAYQSCQTGGSFSPTYIAGRWEEPAPKLYPFNMASNALIDLVKRKTCSTCLKNREACKCDDNQL